MIFVEERNIDNRLRAVEFLAAYNQYEIVIWMYPESKLENILGYYLVPASNVKADPVTKYEDISITVKCTSRLKLERKIILDLAENQAEMKQSVDSICLYLNGQEEWSLCSIGHEGMLLVKDVDYCDELIKAGFNASLSAPDWW